MAKRWIIHLSLIHFFLISFHSCRLLFPKTDSSHRSDLLRRNIWPICRASRAHGVAFVKTNVCLEALARRLSAQDTNICSAERGRARASGQGLVHSSTFWAKRQIDDFDKRGGSVWHSAFSPLADARPIGCRVFCTLGWSQGGACEQCWTLKKEIQKKRTETQKPRNDTGSQHALFSSQCSRLPELQFCPPGHKV